MVRSLEQLRAILLRRGLAATAAGLASELSAHAILTVPAALGASVSTAALAGMVALKTTETLVTTALQKFLIAASVAAVLGGGLYEIREIKSQRTEVSTQERQLAEQRETTRQEAAAAEFVHNSEQREIARQEAAAEFVHNSLKSALRAFQKQMGRLPTTEEGLEALVHCPKGEEAKWNGPYVVAEKLPSDPWGHPYQYRSPALKSSMGYDLWSLGLDGIPSGDDIGNW